VENIRKSIQGQVAKRSSSGKSTSKSAPNPKSTTTPAASPGSEKGVCPHCLGRGFIMGEDENAVPCVCMDEQKLINRFKYARLSRELIKCRLEDFDFSYYKDESNGEHLLRAQKAWQAAQDFAAKVLNDPHQTGLLYTGPVGCGKTFLVAAIANRLIEYNRTLLFLIVPDLLDELRSTFGRSDVSELDLLDIAKTVPILILDDMGAHNYTEWTRNRLYSILNHRVNEQLPTLITTNLDFAEIGYYLGERTSSRLLQMCRVFQLSVPQDIRRQNYTLREKN